MALCKPHLCVIIVQGDVIIVQGDVIILKGDVIILKGDDTAEAEKS